jgi:hypothetical protein
MAAQSADVVICGAGIAGIAAAYSPAAVHGIRDTAPVEPLLPLPLHPLYPEVVLHGMAVMVTWGDSGPSEQCTV